MPPLFKTPILFLLFNRPDTTRLVFNRIREVRPKYLFVAADGPRTLVPGEKETCEETRKIIQEVDWECEVKTLFRKQNLGCGPAIVSAITWFFDAVEEGIILEDDCYPDLSFFPYCQELLIKYRTVEQVKLIGGNNFRKGMAHSTGSYYFSRYLEIWGWATWRRAWANYDFNMSGLEEMLATDKLKNIFKKRGERRYWYKKFQQAKNGEINTWDYQLTYAVVKNGGVAITPAVNLVKNIGISNNPTHLSLPDSNMNLELSSFPFPLIHPLIIVDEVADQYTFSQIYSHSPRRLFRLIKENGIRKFLRYCFGKLYKK